MFEEARQNLAFLDVQYQALLKLGLDLGCRRGKDFIKHPWRLIALVIITSYIQYGLTEFVVHVIAVDVSQAVGALSVLNQTSLLTFKVAVIIYKSDRMLKLISDIIELAKNAGPQEKKAWNAVNRQYMLMSKTYRFVCWMAVTFSTLISILLMGVQYFQGVEVHLKLAFDGRLPFQDRGIHIFIINFILSMMHFYFFINMTVGIDTLFGWYIFAVSSHFRILRIKIAIAAKKIDKDDNHEDLLQDVADIVEYHIKILQFVDELNYIFGQIMWAEVTLSCLQMCFIIHILTDISEMHEMPIAVIGFAAVSIQLMIYGFGGEKVKSENDDLCADIYMLFPWEKMQPAERKLMLLPLMQSQRELTLVGLFFKLDRSLLVYIYRTAFSFYTLLRAMEE